jgi:hypothetical protein
MSHPSSLVAEVWLHFPDNFSFSTARYCAIKYLKSDPIASINLPCEIFNWPKRKAEFTADLSLRHDCYGIDF